MNNENLKEKSSNISVLRNYRQRFWHQFQLINQFVFLFFAFHLGELYCMIYGFQLLYSYNFYWIVFTLSAHLHNLLRKDFRVQIENEKKNELLLCVAPFLSTFSICSLHFISSLLPNFSYIVSAQYRPLFKTKIIIGTFLSDVNCSPKNVCFNKKGAL